uniref:protein-serine/threonine phosphatase n=1 Tax=Ananas comosus var. bracteatus TaxID=296719 RepID=A0A6V7QC76_ANACO|nr:unnamed protein product [Ananas comosus var. bracteatus]
MGDSKAPTRSCARLLSVTKMPALDRAKRRKAILREGETNNPRNLARKWSSKKVAAKSARNLRSLSSISPPGSAAASRVLGAPREYRGGDHRGVWGRQYDADGDRGGVEEKAAEGGGSRVESGGLGERRDGRERIEREFEGNAPRAAGSIEEERAHEGSRFGMISVCGRRREMEDAVSIRPDFVRGGRFDFFGVFDGHGCSHVAMSCKDRMHEVVGEEIDG